MNKRENAPRSSEEKASALMQVRVRPSEKARWEALAKREGLSLSNWIIKNLNGEIK